MKEKKEKWMKEYSNELKLKVVKEALEGCSSAYLAEKYKIRNASLIRQWKNSYLKNGELSIKQMKKQGSGKVKQNKEETLEEKVKRLEMENAVLKKYHELLMEEETKRK
jgi:transposase